MTIGKNVNLIRSNKKMSIRKLTELSGVGKSTISDIENDKVSPTYATLEKLAKAFDISVYELLEEHVSHEDMMEARPMTKEDAQRLDETLNKDGKLKKAVDEIDRVLQIDSFETPEEAMKFILMQPSIMGFGGFDTNTMSDDELIEFANELLNQLKILSYKYKK